MPLSPLGDSPPDLPNRRRSSRSTSISASTTGSSFRSSLGGKPLGPKYTFTSTNQRTPVGTSITSGGSGFSNSDGGNENGNKFVIGSFSATREELRDGSARLASLSLFSGLNTLPTPLDTSTTSNSFSSFPIASTSASTSSLSSSSATVVPGPSNLARGRPTPSPTTNYSSSTSPSTSKLIDETSGSPDSNSGEANEITPTPSNMGSLLKGNGNQSGNSSGIGLGLPRTKSNERGGFDRRLSGDGHHLHNGKTTVLGDEPGGDGDHSGDEVDEDEMIAEAESEGREREVEQEEEDNSSVGTYRNGTIGRETIPLVLGKKMKSITEEDGNWSRRMTKSVKDLANVGILKAKSVVLTRENVKEAAGIAVSSIPAVILGVLMNILDGVSYGMIMFPTNLPVFADFGGIGVSMFFVSCVISQIVYSGGGSIFKGGNGSMMIEVVPFFHVIVGIISASISDDKDIVATTMVAFALSSILMGLTFFALGALKLGSLSEFFPRHILVGCIGGVGAFLFITGLQVSARLDEDAGISGELIRHFFDNDTLPLWLIPLVLAITLRLITSKFSHPLVFPGFFLAIPLVFYAITLTLGITVADLRAAGWVFEVNGVDSEWYEYWTLFDLKKTDFGALIDTIPTQLALVFFGLLHVPINVPALGISVGEDNVNTDRELVAHGISNVLAGMLGTVPNYLCYVNSVLFYKVGGTTRISGFLLAIASFGILILGPGVIGYLPVCVVGALIFILGLDLVKEAVWDTYGRVAQFEYITIWAIIVTMTVYDFVMGIGVGIILACVSFVVSSSQRRAVRSILNGAVARSTVRRHPKQSAFLKEVGRQTRVIKLHNFLFFGTISQCEGTIRKILEAAEWSKNPIRFLVLDFSMASGVDFSAAEAFVRIQRLLEDKQVVLVMCGCPADSSVGLALRSVDLWAGGASTNQVEVFENLNDALEHCENAYLRSLYSKSFDSPHIGPALSSQIDVPKTELDSDLINFEQSPRASHLRLAAKETLSQSESPSAKSNFQQPMPLLLQSLRPFSPELNEDACFRLAPYFKRVHIERGSTIWTTGSESDSFYLIESGMLRASYLFLDRSHSICESMVAGTAAGEMTFLSRTKRNATVVAERDSVLWKMEVASHEEMGKNEGWAFCRQFEQCLMRIACEEQEVLMGHLISSL